LKKTIRINKKKFKKKTIKKIEFKAKIIKNLLRKKIRKLRKIKNNKISIITNLKKKSIITNLKKK
jgi:hypothetical protein